MSMHPLHLLDNLLASLARGEPSSASTDQVPDGNDESEISAAATALAEAKQDLVLRAVDDLFGNNVSLLENALALLDEQDQFQRNIIQEQNNDNDNFHMPVIRKIRAKRSGREAILVKKQRKRLAKKSRSSSINSSQMGSTDVDEKKQQNIMNDYYLCLLGREQTNRRALLTSTGGYSKIYRQGAHCTCRSFFQNIKGGTKRSTSDAPTPSCSNDNVVVCKHLLASILMPHLLPWSVNGIEDEIVDDREFAKLLMRASIG